MEKEAFISLLKNTPEEYSIEQLNQLESLLGQYPYFQNAWALHLKGLKPFDDVAYNKALKRTAALTSDREVLFEFITSEDFTPSQLAEGHPAHSKERDENADGVLAIPETELEFAPATPLEEEPTAEQAVAEELIEEVRSESTLDAAEQETTTEEQSGFDYVDADEFPEEIWNETPPDNADNKETSSQEESAENEVAEVEEFDLAETESSQESVEEVEEIMEEPLGEDDHLIEPLATEPSEFVLSVPEDEDEDEGATEDDVSYSETNEAKEISLLEETNEASEIADSISEQAIVSEEEPTFALAGDSEPLADLEPITEEESELDMIADTALSMSNKEESELNSNPMFQTDFEWEDESKLTEAPSNSSEGDEKKSFTDWLVATKTHSPAPKKEVSVISDVERERKFELLDKFLENNPKIIPVVSEEITVDIEESVQVDRKEIMTETLAQLYKEQGKFKKALKGYEVLSLKYPEKSSFFAAQIQELKALIKEKKKN